MATNSSTSDPPAEDSRRPARQAVFAEPNFSSPATTITLLVTNDRNEIERFVIHKEHACAHSRTLRTAFNGPWEEGQTQEFNLHDTTPRAVRLLARWLYSETHELNLVQLNFDECPTDEECLEEDSTLVELWVLADFLCIPRLQNDIVDYMNLIAAELDRPPSAATYEYIYNNTSEDSALRKAVVMLVVAVMGDLNLRKYANDYPKEMLVDILEMMGRMKKPIDSYEGILEQFPDAYVPVDE